MFKILPNTKWTLSFLPKWFKICLSCENLPNLVTLRITQKKTKSREMEEKHEMLFIGKASEHASKTKSKMRESPEYRVP